MEIADRYPTKNRRIARRIKKEICAAVMEHLVFSCSKEALLKAFDRKREEWARTGTVSDRRGEANQARRKDEAGAIALGLLAVGSAITAKPNDTKHDE
ncbi:hypothetical protein [Congregicoccus parvus]|uniref:hypothetical protein n=1 Tax=Congregicoccus parvus TaxID=3081749 RepID=UPI003FA5EC33